MIGVSDKLSPEFKLLAACCNWPLDMSKVRTQSSAAIDWTLLLRLGRRHRVTSLVNNAFACSPDCLPDYARDELAATAQQVAMKSLHQAAEAHRLQGLLEAAGIAPLFIKGSALAMLAYGSLALKTAYDIDILIRRQEIAPAFEVLRAAGYLPTLGNDIDDVRLREWADKSKDTTWRHPLHGFVVELHTRLFANPNLLPGLPFDTPQKVFISPGRVLATLSAQELPVYLSAHGAIHGWARLKWLADLNALMSHAGRDGLERLFDAARRQGAGRTAGQAILLMHMVFDRPVSDAIIRDVKRERFTRLATWVSKSTMTSFGARELDDIALGTFKLNLAHFFARSGWNYKRSEILAKVAQVSEINEATTSPPTLPSLLPAFLKWVARRRKAKRMLNSDRHALR